MSPKLNVTCLPPSPVSSQGTAALDVLSPRLRHSVSLLWRSCCAGAAEDLTATHKSRRLLRSWKQAPQTLSPDQPVQPDRKAQTAQTAQPDRKARPDQPVQPDRKARPAQTAQTAQTAAWTSERPARSPTSPEGFSREQ